MLQSKSKEEEPSAMNSTKQPRQLLSKTKQVPKYQIMVKSDSDHKLHAKDLD